MWGKSPHWYLKNFCRMEKTVFHLTTVGIYHKVICSVPINYTISLDQLSVFPGSYCSPDTLWKKEVKKHSKLPLQNCTKNIFKIHKYIEHGISLKVLLADSRHTVFPLRYFSNHLCLEFASECILEIHDTLCFWMALNQLAVNVEKSLFLMKKYWWQNSISRTTLTISQQCNKIFPSLPLLS